MVFWIFLPTFFFTFDMLLYFLFGFSHIITLMSFVLFSFFNHSVPEGAQILGLFYLMLQASIFYNSVLIVLVFCLTIRFLFSKIAPFLQDGFALHLIMMLSSIGLYALFIQKIGLIGLKNYTILDFFTILIVTLAQSFFLNSIYGASGQSNRLRKARGKSGHQTGNVPFDKIRTGNKYC